MSEHKRVFTRRDFLRNSMGAAAAVGLSGSSLSQTGDKRSTSHVVLVRNASVFDDQFQVQTDVLQTMLDTAVMKVTGKSTPMESWQALVSPDDTVGLVATQLMNPTHAELIQLVEKSLTDAGVPRKQILMAQRSADTVRQCTALINLPGLKAHWLTGVGTVLKNYIMFSGKPRDYHHVDSAKLGEIWKLDFVEGKTRLNLVDALYAVCDKGPQFDPQYRWAYRGLIAGTDPVAVETVGLKIITEKRNRLKGEPWPLSPPPVCVETADTRYRLGTSNWDEIRLEKAGWETDILV